jgi:hypothetical protein
MYHYIGLGIGIIIILVILYFSFNWSSDSAACIYDNISRKSFIIINDKRVIQDIQKSLNKRDGLYHIEDDKLYKRNKLIKRLVGCTKNNMKFMIDKYSVGLIN